MANIPFLSFPSFSSITRFEHSLGVCYLTGLFADKNKLSEKNKIELMLAALYHDAATPPFAHAMEEVLSDLYGYDHESQLKDLIIGRSKDLGGQHAQLFLGRSLKLHSICQSREGRRLSLDLFRIADIATGTKTDPFGDIICSNDIDFDNIDNVVRAASSMGIPDVDIKLPIILANSFSFIDGNIYIDGLSSNYFEIWQAIRRMLYEYIFLSVDDFSLQTMFKHSVKLFIENEESSFEESDWSLTDDELIHNILLKNEYSKEIVNRMRLGKLYLPLSLFWVRSPKNIVDLKSLLSDLEVYASSAYKIYLQRAYGKVKVVDNAPVVISNYYKDKRYRTIKRVFNTFGRHTTLRDASSDELLYLGLFTPHSKGWDKTAAQDFLEGINPHLKKYGFSLITNGIINR